MKNSVYSVLLAALIAAGLSLSTAQTIIVEVPSDNPPQEGNLNNAVLAAINAGTLSNTVFKLEAYGYYVLIGAIDVPVGQTLTIEGPPPGTTQETAPPQIVWTSSGGVNTQFNFNVFGNITLRNVWLRYANTQGDQIGSSLQFQDDPLAAEGQWGIFEGVIFDYSPCPPNASGAVGITCKKFNGRFKNCYFKNNIDQHLRYYGRALSFPYQSPGWHTQSVEFEHCTFANIGYVYMQEADNYGDNVKFNHCTFLNVVMFPLQSGWWYKLAVTNSLFVNCWMFGNNPAQTGTGDPNGGTLRIDSVSTFPFNVPFTEQDRRILFANSAYFIQPWLVRWMRSNPYSQQLIRERRSDEVPIPQPMLSPNTKRFFDSTDAQGKKVFPYMNRANLYEGKFIPPATFEGLDPGFIHPPMDTNLVKDFMWRKWFDNSDVNWAWKPENDWAGLWPLEEDLSYTNPVLKTASLGGFPLGDLYHWWPEEYQRWKAQEQAEKNRISTWLETGIDPLGPTSVEKLPGSGLPSEFRLGQNYPNPFNPTTRIEYSIPVAGRVSLKVFNALGQEIATLVDTDQNPGTYVATFDGGGLPSGVYFYRLQSGAASLTQKLVLMK